MKDEVREFDIDAPITPEEQAVIDQLTLPLDVQRIRKIVFDHVWATVSYEAVVKSDKEGDEHEGKKVIVKRSKVPGEEGRRSDTFEVLSSHKRLSGDKKAYDSWLKIAPELKKSIPSTLYFRGAQQSEEGPATNYKVQEFVYGKRIDHISNKELYSDPEVVRQLLIFVEGAIKVYEANKSGDDRLNVPDLYGYNLKANLLNMPRHTGNIIISDEPNEHGQKVFFVDTDLNPLSVARKVNRFMFKHVDFRKQLFGLKKWKEKLEKMLRKL